MFELIIKEARNIARSEGFNGMDFQVNKKDFFVDLDSDGTLFITQKIKYDEWEVLIDGINL